MFFDNAGLPRDQGATDFMDSARLAGLMAIIKHPQAPDCREYIVDGYTTRHPSLSPTDFSRDQLLCLSAGLFAQGRRYLIMPPSNGDIMDPAHIMHIRLCAWLPSNFLGRVWLRAQILFHAYCTPLAESNQLIAQMYVAGPGYFKLWRKHNKQWANSIYFYWSGWRNEAELANQIVNFVSNST